MTPDRAIQTISRIDQSGCTRGQHGAAPAYTRRVLSAAGAMVDLIRETGADLGSLTAEERDLVHAVEGTH